MEGAGFVDMEAQDSALHLPQRRKMEILFAILLTLFLSALDQTIVGTALPTIVSDLNGSHELYTWVVTIYLLTATITGVFYGKLSDIFGRRAMLLIGVSIFLLGSFLSGLSWSMEALIVFRGLQGVGAGAIFPVSLAVIGDLFTPRERGKYTGLFGAVFGVSSIVGPLLGGWLTEHLSWNWIFFVNLPIGAVALYIIYRYLPNVHGERGTMRDLDYLGAVVFTVAVGFLLVGLTYKGVNNPATGGLYDWTDPIVGGCLIVAAIAGAIFLWVESRAKEPIVPLDLFKNRGYSATILATFLAAIGFFGAIVFLPLWFQFVKGVSPTESGLQILALLAGLILSSVGSGIVVSRTGRYKVLVIVAMAGMALGLYLMTGLTAATSEPQLWVWMFITGLGVGPSFAVFTIIVQSVVPFERLGVATGNLTFFRQIGGSIGLAVVGTLFSQTFAQQLPVQFEQVGLPPDKAAQFGQQAANNSQLTNVGTDLSAVLTQAGVPPNFVQPVIDALHQAFSLAVASTFWFGVIATVLALITVTVLLPEVPLRGMSRSSEPEGSTPRTEVAAPAA
jgi:EmrB/QacA subfamily drug resistance transporter